jgi:hypothetical protein
MDLWFFFTAIYLPLLGYVLPALSSPNVDTIKTPNGPSSSPSQSTMVVVGSHLFTYCKAKAKTLMVLKLETLTLVDEY